MIVSEKSYQNNSDYLQFLFKKRFEVNKKGIISSEKMIDSGNYIYDYAHSFFGDGSYPMHYTVIMVSTFFRSFWNLMELFMDYIYILPNMYNMSI